MKIYCNDIYTLELEAKKLTMTIDRVVSRSICAGSKRTYSNKNEASKFKRLCLFDESQVGLSLEQKIDSSLQRKA